MLKPPNTASPINPTSSNTLTYRIRVHYTPRGVYIVKSLEKGFYETCPHVGRFSIIRRVLRFCAHQHRAAKNRKRERSHNDCELNGGKGVFFKRHRFRVHRRFFSSCVGRNNRELEKRI